MELINLYVKDVAKRLPPRMRKDIGSEIRSILMDMLEERSQREGRPADEAMAMELLREYGSPERVAATYLPEHYLIGPQLYPVFSLVLKIVLGVLAALALVGLGAAVFSGEQSFKELLATIARSVGSYYETAIAAFGNIVLVFLVLERVLPASQRPNFKDEPENWDPTELVKQTASDEVSFWGQVATILFTFAALVIFNFYPEVFRYTPSLNDPDSIVSFPILSEAFFAYLPWLNVQWLMQIGLSLALIRTRRWTVGTRLFDVLIKVLAIGILTAMLRGPSLLDLSPAALASWPGDLQGTAALANLLNTLLRIALVLGVFGSAVEIVKDFVWIFKKLAGDR